MTRRPLTFIVGTGRTGSSALSRILRMHPRVLSMNELFVSLDGGAALPSGPLSGEGFWRLLATPHPVFDEMIRLGVPLPEFLYPDRPGRFSVETTGIPAISLMALPHLSDEPDRIFDALAAEVPGWPERDIAQHYEALFDVLASLCGGEVVVERSGHSLSWVGALWSAFPQAKFVHMFRDGPDCALSMSRHGGYRTAALASEILELAGVSTFADLTEGHVSQLPADLRELVTVGFMRAFTLEREIPVSRFGSIWSKMITNGIRALDEIPAELCTTLRYEALLRSPAGELARLAEFIGVDAEQKWIEAGCALLDASKRGASLRLAPGERAELEETCAPGMLALRAALGAMT